MVVSLSFKALCLLRAGGCSGNVMESAPHLPSYKNWTGQLLKPDEGAPGNLVRHYLHCYGPSGVDGFVNWLGVPQAGKVALWNLVSGEMEPVMASGKKDVHPV